MHRAISKACSWLLPLRGLNREPSATPMQGSNPTIYAVVLSIMHSLVEMHVSGAVTHSDPERLQLWEILQHNLHDLPKVQRLRAVTFLRLLSPLSRPP